MQKLLIPLIITLLSLIGDNCFAQFGGGNGTAGNPYIISTSTHLATIATNVNNGTNNYSGVYFTMTSNINLPANFTPIGYNSTRNFNGNFNGNNYKIRMSKITSPYNSRSGLFGHTKNANIENVSMVLDSIYITGNQDNNVTGILIAYADNTIINNCNIGDSTDIYYSNLKTGNVVGGMIGYAYNSTINLSYSLCSLRIYSHGDNNYNSIGGLIGKSVNCTINNCFTRNDIFTDSQNNNSGIGGLVGTTQNSTFSNSFSAPNSFRSGFPFTGVIVSDTSAADSNVFDNCYYLIDTAVHAVSDVGTGLTIDQMLDDSFADSLNQGQNPPVWDSDGGLPFVFPRIVWEGGGTGSESNPFLVRYVKDLINMSETVKARSFKNYYLRLENDINFNNGVIDSSSYFSPIGNYSNGMPFSGNLNGNGKALVNYKYNNADSSNVGIFGYIKNATIKNLGISNLNIKAKDTIGGLVAVIDAASTIDSCFVYGFISGIYNVGGLVGLGISSAPKINMSFTNVCIDAQTNVGGIAGSYKGMIANSYSNSEIYSSTDTNNYVGGIIGFATDTTTIINVYSASKIIRNGNDTNFGKIVGNNLVANTNSYSRDSVFVNYTNITPSGFNGIQKSNSELRSLSFITDLNNSIWKSDYADNINDGYPILSYQPQAIKPNSSGLWPTTTASQVVIIKSGVQLKADTANFPKCAYVKIEAGGELNNTTNINLFGEYNRELYVGKWNLIGLSTYNQTLASLYNYADTSFKTFVKEFDYITNNWSTTTTQGVNTKFEIGEGILVMPNYSLDDRLIIKSRIVSKGVLFNDTTLSYNFNNTSSVTNKFVALANNYPASIKVTQANPPISGNAGLIQGNLVYVYDADSGKWNNNLQTTTGAITKIKPSEGFFIATNTANSIFHFNKSQINNTSGAKNETKSNLIYITANTDNETRQAFLEYSFDADNDFDFQDGLMMFGTNPNSVEPYLISTTQQLNKSINEERSELIKDAFSSLPYTTELNLRSYSDKEVKLSFSNIPSGIYVYLIDSVLKTSQCLNDMPDYDLEVGVGDNKNRLYILFSFDKKDINDFFKAEISQEIRVWNYNNTLNIKGKDLIRYEIYDIMGNKIIDKEIHNDDYQTLLNINSGIFIVKAYSRTGFYTKKISL